MYYKLPYLDRKTEAEFASAFSSIPENVTILDLRQNDLRCWSRNKLDAAFSALPSGVRSLYLPRYLLGYQIRGKSVLVKQEYQRYDRHQLPIEYEYYDTFFQKVEPNFNFFNALPPCINELTFNLSNEWEDKHLLNVGKSLPFVTKIDVVNNHDIPVEHPALNILRNSIGSGVMQTYCALSDNKDGPGFYSDIARLILSYQTGADEAQLRSFVDTRDKQLSYEFQLQCLQALAAISVITLALGIAAIMFNFITTSIVLASAGSVGLSLASFGLYRTFEVPSDENLPYESTSHSALTTS